MSTKFRRRARFYAERRAYRAGWRELAENMRLAMILNGWA